MIFFEYHSEYVCFYNYWKTFTIYQVPVAGQEARRKLAVGYVEVFAKEPPSAKQSSAATALSCDTSLVIMTYYKSFFFYSTGDHFLDVGTGKSYFLSGLLVVMQSNICGRIR